jgi:hypothetical protein
MCVCVTAKPQGLIRRGVHCVIFGYPVGLTHPGKLEVREFLPEHDAFHDSGVAPRKSVLSSEVDHLSRPVRAAPPLRLGPQEVVGVRTQVKYKSTF